MNRSEAIRTALGVYGTRTSVETIRAHAQSLCGLHVSDALTVLVRIKYRKQRGETADCRKYGTQVRRNMLDDDKISIHQLQEMIGHFRETGIKPSSVLNVLEKFKAHSLEQLTGTIKILAALS